MPVCTCAEPMGIMTTLLSIDATIGLATQELIFALEEMDKSDLAWKEANQALQTAQFELFHATIYGQALGGVPGAMANVRFAHAAPPEYGPIGENTWSVAFEAANTAIALANSVAQGDIADKQQDLSERYYDMASSKWSRFESQYMPLEKQLVNEVAAEPIKDMDCTGAIGQATENLYSTYSDCMGALNRDMRAMHLCNDYSPIRSAISYYNNQLRVDMMDFAMEDEHWYTDYKNDKRWNRRNAVLNIGRNMASDALKYGDVAMKTFGRVGQQIQTAATGMASALGYYGGRNDTYYPTTFLSSYGNSSNSMVIGTQLRQNQNATQTLNASIGG